MKAALRRAVFAAVVAVAVAFAMSRRVRDTAAIVAGAAVAGAALPALARRLY